MHAEEKNDIEILFHNSNSEKRADGLNIGLRRGRVREGESENDSKKER